MPFDWKPPNEAPVPDNADLIVESINRFWEENHEATIKVMYSYKLGTMAFSLNIKGGDSLCYMGIIDTVEARKIVEILDEIRMYAQAI